VIKMHEETRKPSQSSSNDIRPVGGWVIGGFLIATIVTIWVLTSFVFVARS